MDSIMVIVQKGMLAPKGHSLYGHHRGHLTERYARTQRTGMHDIVVTLLKSMPIPTGQMWTALWSHDSMVYRHLKYRYGQHFDHMTMWHTVTSQVHVTRHKELNESFKQ